MSVANVVVVEKCEVERFAKVVVLSPRLDCIGATQVQQATADLVLDCMIKLYFMSNEEDTGIQQLEHLRAQVREVDPALRETLLGNKPSCLIRIDSFNGTTAIPYLEAQGFECVPIHNIKGAELEWAPTMLAVARPEAVTKLITQEMLAHFCD